jgi:hypothetical protein
VQKKLLSGKIGKILEGGARVKDDQVENVKSELELRVLIHFPWKVYSYPFSLESLRERRQLRPSSAWQ